MDMEEGSKKQSRQKWFELLHSAGPDVDWQEIEKENSFRQNMYKRQLRKNNQNRDGEELVADGYLEGKWIERGSNNQAGNMMTVNYFKEEDLFIGRSAGGTLWTGDMSGFNWNVINQDYNFTSDLVEMRYNEDGGFRYIAALNGRPVYSDDGEIWNNPSGLQITSNPTTFNFVETPNDDLFIFYKAFNSQLFQAFKSSDAGESWENIGSFNSNDTRDLNMVNVANSNDVMVVQQKNTDLSTLYLYTPESGEFTIMKDDVPVGFGANDRAYLNANYAEDTLRIYLLNHENEFYESKDSAQTWEKLTSLPTDPWEVGVYVCPSDYTQMMYGEVNSYRSKNGGNYWSKVSEWWEYYGNVYEKLHADIMDIKEFETMDGEHFLAVCNHGGVSVSRDYGKNFENIGLFTMNISQYYSVATHPTQREYVFAGSQDQGFQRGEIFGEDVASFDQVISGDYGHIVFTGDDDNLWTVYPGGLVHYYDNPTFQGPSTEYTLNSDNESVWIPPLIPNPEKSVNAIYMAGGNINGGPGSHMIRLDVQNNNIVATQFDFDFRDSGGEVSAMDISTENPNFIMVSTTNGRVYKSIDGGLSFNQVAFNLSGSHYLYGSDITISKVDPNIVYLSGSGYSAAPVYISTDAGESFSAMNTGMPNTVAFNLAFNEDETLIFAATQAGPFVYIKDQERWFDLSGSNTPTQTYWSVEFIPESQTARFGTYGRGIWDFDLSRIISSTDNDITNNIVINCFPNPTSDQVTITGIPASSQILLADIGGRIIKNISNYSQSQIDFSLADYESGIYFVTIINDKNSVTKKIIKQ